MKEEKQYGNQGQWLDKDFKPIEVTDDFFIVKAYDPPIKMTEKGIVIDLTNPYLSQEFKDKTYEWAKNNLSKEEFEEFKEIQNKINNIIGDATNEKENR